MANPAVAILAGVSPEIGFICLELSRIVRPDIPSEPDQSDLQMKYSSVSILTWWWRINRDASGYDKAGAEIEGCALSCLAEMFSRESESW